MEEAGDAKHASESIYLKLLPRNVKMLRGPTHESLTGWHEHEP